MFRFQHRIRSGVGIGAGAGRAHGGIGENVSAI